MPETIYEREWACVCVCVYEAYAGCWGGSLSIINLYQCNNPLFYCIHKTNFSHSLERCYTFLSFHFNFYYCCHYNRTTITSSFCVFFFLTPSPPPIWKNIPSPISEFLLISHRRWQRFHSTEHATTNEITHGLFFSPPKNSMLPQRTKAHKCEEEKVIYFNGHEWNENGWNEKYRKKAMRQHTKKIADEANWKIKLQRHL